jgi:hypothetical protein
MLLSAVGADFGLNLAFIFSSPGTEQRTNDGSKYANDSQNDPRRHLPSSLRLIAGASETQPSAGATQTENPPVNQQGANVWTILQGLSAPVVALFTLVLMCVGWGN